MFEFFATIFNKAVSAFASIIIAVGLVSAPAPQPEPPPQAEAVVEAKQGVQELEKIKLEAELEKAKAETARAKAEAEKARREAEAAKREAEIKKEPTNPDYVETREQQLQRFLKKYPEYNASNDPEGKKYNQLIRVPSRMDNGSQEKTYFEVLEAAHKELQRHDPLEGQTSPVYQPATALQDAQIKIEVCKVEARGNYDNLLIAGKAAINEALQERMRDQAMALYQSGGVPGTLGVIVDSLRSKYESIAQQEFEKLRIKADEMYNQRYVECLNKQP